MLNQYNPIFQFLVERNGQCISIFSHDRRVWLRKIQIGVENEKRLEKSSSEILTLMIEYVTVHLPYPIQQIQSPILNIIVSIGWIIPSIPPILPFSLHLFLRWFWILFPTLPLSKKTQFNYYSLPSKGDMLTHFLNFMSWELPVTDWLRPASLPGSTLITFWQPQVMLSIQFQLLLCVCCL